MEKAHGNSHDKPRETPPSSDSGAPKRVDLIFRWGALFRDPTRERREEMLLGAGTISVRHSSPPNPSGRTRHHP